MTSVIRGGQAGTESSPDPAGTPLVESVSGATSATSATSAASYLSLLLFYLPLGFSGFMMMLDTPIVNGVLNRFPNPDTSVAALRVAFSMALVYEASHISMIDISTALSADRRIFGMLRRFYGLMSAALLVVASFIAFSPLYDFIVRDVMNIPVAVAEAARPAVWAFLLWPIPIGWRRLCQGALIRHGHPKPVGAGGLVRMASLVVALAFFSWFGTSVVRIEPAAIAVLAMLVSVTAESLAVQGWTSRILRRMPETTPESAALTYGDLWRFFFPLGSTAIMNTIVQPLLTAGIASAAVAWASPGGATVAVASYAIAWSMGILMFGPTLSMTQASIAWSRSPDPSVRRRGPYVLVGVGITLALLVALLSLTPAVYLLFNRLLDAPPLTASMAADVVRLFIPMPVLHATSYMLRGRLIAMGRPTVVRRAQVFDLAALFLLVQLGTLGLVVGLFRGMPAAPLAAVAYNLMLVVDITVLLISLRRVKAGQ